MTLSRREFIKWTAAAAGASAVAGCATPGAGGGARVVVVGGGYGGATAARYIKLWAPDIDVTLVERNANFVSCPISNLVIGGNAELRTITMSYSGLAKHSIRVVRDEVVAIDADKRQVRLAGGSTLGYDRLIVSPGIDFNYGQIAGLSSAAARDAIPHAWKAGPQTAALRSQLAAILRCSGTAFRRSSAPGRCKPIWSSCITGA